jgi:hypothetical protein
MIAALSLTAILLTAWVDDPGADFLARVEKDQWLDSDGKPMPRILRDDQGNVDTLHLAGMKLSADDFAAIARLKSLRHLDLYRTNVRDADLRQLRELSHLVGLNLTSTEVTDSAIDEIVKLDSLRTLCLGNVAITPEAVARLKEHFRDRPKRLELGYFQRKPAASTDPVGK